jgi:hypothetical protein
MIIFLELRVVSKAHNNVRIYLRDESCKLSSSFMFARPWYDGTDAAREAGWCSRVIDAESKTVSAFK